jgi:hypothetical protein
VWKNWQRNLGKEQKKCHFALEETTTGMRSFRFECASAVQLLRLNPKETINILPDTNAYTPQAPQRQLNNGPHT